MPTLSMNCRREQISLITTREISCSFFESLSASKKSIASSIESAARFTIFVPLAGPLCSSGSLTDPRKTFSDSGRRRAPPHTSHGSSPKKYLLPSPLHSGHAPYGELNEKRRGSISGNEKPSYGHMNFAETTRVVSAPTVACGELVEPVEGLLMATRPSLSCSAFSIASHPRSRVPFGSSLNSDTNISSD